MSAIARLHATSPQAPLTFASFKGAHAGESIVVCGCGESVNELKDPVNYITIGVNDIGRLFHPNYLVVVNPRSQFSADRFQYVEGSRASFVFTQYNELGIPPARTIEIRLGRYAATDFSDPALLHYTQNSPYVAVCLAVHMGAKRIGLIGVDFTENHFFGRTGQHPLAHRLARINREYANLARACRRIGVELLNLSGRSRLTGLPKATLSEMSGQRRASAFASAVPDTSTRQPRIFFVNYRFLSCGEVFSEGLRHGAIELGLAHEEALWDDPQLRAKVERFAPDLLFVVHGRRFAHRWGDAFAAHETAVWLMDEPYEVDDTAAWSRYFKTVFVNDPSTLGRHRNARYLPVGFDPVTHQAGSAQRPHKVGFIGGYNEVRQRYLACLARAGLLTYVVGGPWSSPDVSRLCIAANIPALRTAELYRQTEIVVNVFRAVHHFNVRRLVARSMNPRIYEALACGALVVSEPRAEIGKLFPDLPQFANPEELIAVVTDLLANRQRLTAVKSSCRARLDGHSYADRLKEVIAQTMGRNYAEFLEVGP